MFKPLFVIALLAGTGIAHASDDPAVTACEIAVESVMQTPATYARIGVTIEKNIVKLTYDSHDSAGALVRDRAECTFTSSNGSFQMTGLFVNGKNLEREIFSAVAQPQWQAAGVDQIAPDFSQLSDP
ncbi:hypothetical protein OSH11_01545 [Kaistia dalseonensis]|uniref:Uncharacterized protein n=1 Tax=Kaistia dalseonensis TaxID=410840 RepID=A0ABU0H0W2_9HYPH|nr:hypothetical protein [Kaistia dalseonensis]MCX5493378.1 hypothetical protein [Kaistia dalseonensis]MDQ0435936.1 hypothetical protein [Kaistia dalseonensis]